jgi:hypothetical protein
MTKFPVGTEIKNEQNSQPVTANGTKCGLSFCCGVGVLCCFLCQALENFAHMSPIDILLKLNSIAAYDAIHPRRFSAQNLRFVHLVRKVAEVTES